MNKEKVISVIKEASENLSSVFSSEQLDDFTVLTDESEYALCLGDFIASVIFEVEEKNPTAEDFIFVAEKLAEAHWALFDSSDPNEKEYVIADAEAAFENVSETFKEKLVSFVSSEIE